MNFFNKSTPVEVPARITKRVRALSRDDLIMWADQALTETGRALTAFNRDGNANSLVDAVTGSQVLTAIVSELQGRAT